MFPVLASTIQMHGLKQTLELKKQAALLLFHLVSKASVGETQTLLEHHLSKQPEFGGCHHLLVWRTKYVWG